MLTFAGISDWLDGYVAKHFNQESVLGSYLDPLADKFVIVCVVGALGWAGTLSPPVVTVLVGRDVLLVTGGLLQRCAFLLLLNLSGLNPIVSACCKPECRVVNTHVTFDQVERISGMHASAERGHWAGG